MFITIVIPIYNESACLEENLRAVHAFLEAEATAGYEVIGVDDGSADHSASILERLQGEMPLQVLRHDKNRGKGAAVRRGMLAAKGDVHFFFDADLSTPLEELLRFMTCIREGADLVIGNRKSFKAKIKKMQPPHRILMGLGYTCMVNLLLGTRFADFTCGFKAFSREASNRIFPKTRIDGWSFDVEILYLAHLCGLDVREIPVTWENKPGSKVSLIRDTFRSFAEVLKVRAMHRSLHRERKCLQSGTKA